jgi:PucR-like helix-turn-helix protein/diguanylate cyclase with GGDEF domain
VEVNAGLGPTAVQRAGDHLLEHLDDLVEQITERVWQAVPGYNDILVDRTVLSEQVRPNVVDTLEFMRSGRDIDDGDRARLDELGRSRALQGVPMAAMVQSFRTAERVLIDAFCVFCIRSSVNSAEQRTGIQAISALLDKVEAATFASYLETHRQLQQDHLESVAVLVARLVDGSANDPVEIDAHARLVGANPSLAYRCIALAVVPEGGEEFGDRPSVSDWDATDPMPRLARLRRHVVTRLIEARIPTPIIGTRDDALILLVPVTRRDAPAAVSRAIAAGHYRHSVVGGVGDTFDSLFAARASCQQALAALDVGVRQRRTRELVSYGDVLLEVMLLGSREPSRRLIQGYLAPIDDHPLLLETVQTYMRLGQSAQATADQLVVHVNTVSYRLRRVRELTGHDIREQEAGVNFALALRARELLGR